MKKLHLILIAVVLIITSEKTNSQSFTPALSIPVTVNGNQIVNPWAGGLNSPQFSEIDLNGDGIKDLFVFETEGASQNYYRYSTYLNMGAPNQVDYHYAPQYISKFPDGMHDWALLADYNCDGKEDVFTYSYYGGVTVYKNVSSGSNLQFTLKDSLLYSNYFGFAANLYIAASDLAAFADFDGDGDLDIFANGVSGQMEFHKNHSVENYGICDSLIFTLDTTYTLPLISSPGKESILALDNDGDSDKDLLLNKDGYNGYLHYYENTGTPQTANFVLFDDSFPSYNIPANLLYNASPFYIDVNNDNKKDLLVSPHLPYSENINNVEYYQNITMTGVNNFNFVNHNFLGDNMIDVGAGANVQFFDADKDGLQDLIIGNYSRKEIYGSDTSSLSYYRNTGTAANPAYQFITNDFANTHSLGILGLAPTFCDLDGDGDDDMLIGSSSGNILLYTNTAGAGNPANFVLTNNNLLTVPAVYSTPQLFDVNQDGLTDLICGTKLGKIYYYENTGTASNPVFFLISNFWGGVNVTASAFDIYGYSTPFIYLKNGSLELLVGSLRGFIYHYGNISGNLGGTFTLLDTLYGNIYEPIHATVSGTDINGDGTMDLAVGNYAGGLTIYTQNPTGILESNLSEEYFNVFPNPNSGLLTIEVNKGKASDTRIVLENFMGQRMFEKSLRSVNGFNSFKIDLNEFDNGIYLLQLITENKSFTKKIVIQK